jgi:hypothetical protein
MKSKKPGYRAGGPTSRVRPRTPARRVAGKPTPLQTEQMRAAATLASKQAASKRRATLAQRKRTMAANERARTGTMTLADRGYTPARARAQAKAEAANKQNPNLDIKPNTGKTSAQRKRMMAAKKNRPAQPNAQPLSKRMTAANVEIRLRADLNRARAKAAAANKQNPNPDIKPNTGKTSAQRKKLFNAASSMAVDKFNANVKNKSTPKAKSAIHGSLEAFAAAAAASTKNRSTPKAKLEPQTPRQTLNKRKAPTKPNTIGRGQVNKRFKGITSNVKRGNIDR